MTNQDENSIILIKEGFFPFSSTLPMLTNRAGYMLLHLNIITFE